MRTRFVLVFAAGMFPALAWGAAAPECVASQLKPRVYGLDGGVEHAGYALEVTNLSVEACGLRGSPAIRFVGEDRTARPVASCANCADYLFARVPSAALKLRKGESAFLLLGITMGQGVCRETNEVKLSWHAGQQVLVFHDESWRNKGFLSCGRVNLSAWRAGKFDSAACLTCSSPK